MYKTIITKIPALLGAGVSLIMLSSLVNKNHGIVDNLKFTAAADTEQNRYTKTVLSEKLDEPLQMLILKDQKVLFIERKGNIKLYDPATKATTIIATIPVSTKYKDRNGKISEAEDGLLGVVTDPDFDKNHWLYLYYSEAGDEAKNILTRYEFIDDKLILSSKKVLLEVPVQREQCCHTGGKMAFDESNNLYLTTGDNTSSKATPYSPADERAGREPWDAQRTSGNTNDLRGKILRIHPEPDGTYTVPEGNLFPKGTEKTKPEIYVMGIRNPYSLFLDKRSGYLYWGEVGPDASKDEPGRGPKSYDEYNRTKKPGFFGWPYFQADNKPYNKFDFATNTSGPLFDPEHPVNTSPNNTGLTKLPPTQRSFIWYPYDISPEFPLLGTGGRSAMVGPIYYADDYPAGKRFPNYYNGKLFIFEWLRDWIIAVTMDKDGNYQSMEKFLPGMSFSHPMDLKFGPDGDMYILEYGQGWFTQNNDAQLVHITYNGGNRKPTVVARADKPAGALPLKVKLSADGTTDSDNDQLSYKWSIVNKAGKKLATLTGKVASYTFKLKGNYKATLTVTDAQGAVSSKTIAVKAGNEPPVININVAGNQQFYFPDKPFNYSVVMRDREDGVIPGGKIPASKLKVNISYMGVEAEETLGHKAPPTAESFAAGKALMLKNDCKACHDVSRKIIGPSYKDVAAKYKEDDETVERLATKIINGGTGVWGEMHMSAHPQLAKDDAKSIVHYILNINAIPAALQNLAAKGSYTPTSTNGNVVIRASYTDKGVTGVAPAYTEKAYTLLSPVVQACSGTIMGDYPVTKKRANKSAVFVRNSGSIHFDNTDLTGISKIGLDVSTPNNTNGGKIEIRLGGTTGTLLGSVIVNKGVERKLFNVDIPPTAGRQNLYLVFTGTVNAENLMYIDNVLFAGK
ncbi:carbohydrate-binding protein [Mucilaginibacter limnophilus]|uniref:Carbohydrate-binding protein n=1 Tax=Mucilaginibacter limnophilus TaxID=1932778 RepID=A0A3S2Y451_9SPHI|nr:PQQ-dependent sugar dehydrogenase [Mucilaginibacter limnophilus]RVU03062.1 carbohydrate-binding protein [Mucilaginibacter limnophilus]